MENTLPYSSKIDTVKLGKLFDNMSESYKIFWFQAIVNKAFAGKTLLTYDELINEMIADGWYMVSEYKLNLGPSDTLEKVIIEAFDVMDLKTSEKKDIILKTLDDTDNRELQKMKMTLTLNVPYRLQAPFLQDVKGDTWHKKGLTDIINDHDDLLYYFENKDGLNSTIRINNDFAEYVKDNYAILCGWIRYNLIEYLQRRNPSVPGIVNKIDPPLVRKLNAVTNYWKEVMRHQTIQDIYTEKYLNETPISIDHFVPWSYVAHDELWNLVPTTKSVNSSKSNHLANWDLYFQKLSDIQYQAYQIRHIDEHMEKTFQNCLNEYVNDMDVQRRLYKENQSELEFRNQLEDILRPVYISARNLGFTEWELKE